MKKFVDRWTRRVLVDIMSGTLKPERIDDGILKYMGGDIVIGQKLIAIYGIVFQSDDVIDDIPVSEIIKHAWEKVK